MIPTQSAMEIPLLETIYELGGTPGVADVYPKFAENLLLTASDLQIELEDGRSKFQTDAQYTRQKLVGKGQISKAVRGKWIITDQGVQRLIDAGKITIEETDIEDAIIVEEADAGTLVEGETDQVEPTVDVKSVVFKLPIGEIENIANTDLKVNSELYINPLALLGKIQEVLLIDRFCVFSLFSAINAGYHVMLYGPPGTAKTTISKILPKYVYAVKSNVHTADNSWSVKTTIGGLKIRYHIENSKNKEYISPVDGHITQDIFDSYKNIYLDGDEGTPYQTTFSVIDEFNRTNMDECMGPLFTAMGSEENKLKLEYYDGYNDNLKEITIPNSYRMICSMNKYDRTFTTELSDALTRRFKWVYVGPPSNSEKEEELILKKIYSGQLSDIEMGENLIEIPKIENVHYLKTSIAEIFKIINDLRDSNNLNLGTSYKQDCIKIFHHYFYIVKPIIKVNIENTTIDIAQKNAFSNKLDQYENSYDDLISVFTDDNDKEIANRILTEIFNEVKDATLCMCIVPACEAIDDPQKMEKVKQIFETYPNSKVELERINLF